MKCFLQIVLMVFVLACMPNQVYAKEEMPAIDGKIDSIWKKIEEMQAEVGCKEGMSHGHAKVLYHDNVLYLLAEVEDETISQVGDTVSDGVMFMVSCEDENKKETWCGFANTTGKIFLNTGQEELFGDATCAVKQKEKAYVVEIALPIKLDAMTERIGFNFFIIDDKNDDYSRDNLCSWKEYENEIWDWEKIDELDEIQLAAKNKNGVSTKIGMVVGIVLVGVIGVIFYWNIRCSNVLAKKRRAQ